MQAFEYGRPETIEEACEFLGDYDGDVVILGGGQSLLPQLRLRLADIDCVLDINGIPDVAYVDERDGRIRVGMLARYRDIIASTAVEQRCRMLHEAVSGIGDTQVRNRGTLCGSIAHADPAGDPPVVATALDASIVATNTEGNTTYEAGSFFQGFYETALEDGEIVTEVRFPTIEEPSGGAYEKYEPSEGSYPVATVAAVVVLEDDTIAKSTIVTGATGEGPTPLPKVSEQLIGQPPSDDVLTDAAERVGDHIDPIEDAEGSVRFKREIIKTLTKRALTRAVSRAGGRS